jgi:rhamnosyl/mannosyltransferase
MKVLISNKYFPPFVGGVETVAEQQAYALAENGYSVTVLAFKSASSGSVERNVPFKLIEVSPLFVFKNLPFSFKYIYYFFMLAYRSDLIIGHYPFPLFDFLVSFVFKNNAKVVFWHSDILKQKILRWLVYPFTKIMLFKCSVLTTSLSLRNNSLFLRNITEVHIFPLGVEISAYPNKIDPLIFENICDTRGRRIPIGSALFFGRLTSYKNVTWFIKLVKQFEQYNFVLCGSGDQNTIVQREVDCELDNLFWVQRYLSHLEKLAVFSSAKLYVFPSNLETEAYGITQIESLVMGTPVLNQNLRSGVPDVTAFSNFNRTVSKNCFDEFRSCFYEMMEAPLTHEESIKLQNQSRYLYSQTEINKAFIRYIEGLVGSHF